MIRKWSYINFENLINTNFTPLIYGRLKSTFKFKIFRKNTRFKKYNLGNTYFTRKIVILSRRRLGFKPYFHLAMPWVRHTLSSKKSINMLQCKNLYSYSVYCPYTEMLTRRISAHSVIGIGKFAVNYFFSKNAFKKIINSFYNVNSNTNWSDLNCFSWKNKTKKVALEAQFINSSSLTKLNKLGFSFPQVISQNSIFIPTQAYTNPNSRSNINLVTSNNILTITANTLTSVRRVHTYMLILFLPQLKK